MMEFMAKHSGFGAAQDEPDSNSPGSGRVISDSTPIRLGFIVALLGVCIGGFGAGIWWAATLSAKTDTIITQLTTLSRAADGHASAIADLQAWRKLVDTVGTPAMMTKTAELSKEIEELQRQFELHKATTMKGP